MLVAQLSPRKRPRMTTEPADQTINYIDCRMTEHDIRPIASGTVAAFSTRCPGKETPNEDAAALIPLDPARAVLVVADGLGGQPAGDQAAKLALKAVDAAVRRAHADNAELTGAILEGFESANKNIADLGLGAATTLAVLEIQHHTVRPYHAGDTMILIVSQRGRIKLQTIAHSPVGYAVEAGLMEARQAIHHQDRHIVSNMVGTPEMRIEVGPPFEIHPRDTVLIATDGLLDNLHLDEIVKVIRKSPLPQVAATLAQNCDRRMNSPGNGRPSKPDDLTFLIYRPIP